MKAEDAAGTIFQIVIIGETSQLSGGLIGKPNTVSCLNPLEGASGISAGLPFHGCNVLALFICFGLHNANRDAIHKKGIIHRPSAGREFPYRYTGTCHRIELPHIL